MKATFLLGSGVSVPAGLPGVDEITKQVVCVNDFRRGSNWVYRRVKGGDESTFRFPSRFPSEEDIRILLEYLQAQVACRFAARPSRFPNYEDLAYLAGQIRDDLLGDYANPALEPLIIRCLEDLKTLLDTGTESPREQLRCLAVEVVDYILDVLVALLGGESSQFEHLSLFLEAAMDSELRVLNLFTLNHDTLLEGFFESNGTRAADGFDRPDRRGMRWWNPASLDAQENGQGVAAVRLLKLHGSVNWHRFRPREPERAPDQCTVPTNPWGQERVGIQLSRPVSGGGDDDDEQEAVGRPLILVGTFGKMVHYTDDVFLELHYRFHRALAAATHLVVCGYGFGDRGINKRITGWLTLGPHSEGRRLLVINRSSLDELQEKARLTIGNRLRDWQDQGKLLYWPLPLGSEEVTWDRIRKEFLCLTA
jgi:hypothetical protein